MCKTFFKIKDINILSFTALKIHVSENCQVILSKLGGYKLQERGLIPIKVGNENGISNE